jgi:hypothetical protein
MMRVRFGLALSGALAVGMAVAGMVSSGDGTVRAHAADGHPARIQEGTCDNLGRAAFKLTGVGATVSLEGTPIAEPEAVGAKQAVAMDVSDTTLATTLSDLIAKDYAVVVYESDEAMDHIIACGAVGGPLSRQMAGMVMPGDEVAIGLAAENDSGATGVALLRANGENATMRIVLIETGEHEAADHAEDHGATPEAG